VHQPRSVISGAFGQLASLRRLGSSGAAPAQAELASGLVNTTRQPGLRQARRA
jgi:hypothetical protein